MTHGMPIYPRARGGIARGDMQPPSEAGELNGLLAELGLKLDRYFEQQTRVDGAIWSQPIPGLLVPLSAGTGTLENELYMLAPPGCMMSLRRLTLSGFTAGTATAYISEEDPAVPYTAAASNTFGKGEILLDTGDHLSIVASGITGQVVVHGRFDVFQNWYLPRYLG